MAESAEDRQFHLRVAEDLGAIKDGIKTLHEKFDKSNERIDKLEIRATDTENWRSGITAKITLLAAGGGILMSLIFDWVKNYIKNYIK